MTYAADLAAIGQKADAELTLLQSDFAYARELLTQIEGLLSVTAEERDALLVRVADLEARIAELTAPPPPPVIIHPTYRVADGTAAALDAALAKAEPGDTVHFPAGDYAHANLRWPDGVHLTGEGIGASRLNFRPVFGSEHIVGGVTLGSTGSFYFADGAHGLTFEDARFRSTAAYLFDLCDYTALWANAVRRSRGNFWDIEWHGCEFEGNGGTGRTFNIWWDARPGGGSIHDLTWQDCTFGVRNKAGLFGPGNCHLLIQPSPPEHAPDGPRPPATGDPGGINHTAFGFDFGRVDHGAGQAAPGGADGYGFRVIGCDMVGTANLASIDLCDYVRAWAMVTYRLTDPGAVTQAMRDAAPDRVTTKGFALEDSWLSGKFIREYGRGVVDSGNLVRQGTAYHVSAAVLEHDRELYG